MTTDGDRFTTDGYDPSRAPAGGRAWVPRVASLVSLGLGVLNVVAVISPAWHRRLSSVLELLPGVLVNAATFATALTGLLFLVLVDGLARRKRRAWWLAVLLLSVSLVLRLLVIGQLHWRGVELSAVSVVLLVFLLVYRAEFYAVADPRSRWRVLAGFLLSLGIGTLVGYAVVLERERFVDLPIGVAGRLAAVWLGFLGVPTSLDAGDTRGDDVMYFTLLGIGIAIAVVVLYLLLRSPRPLPILTAADEARMRDLVTEGQGEDSLGYFALRGDKSVIWSRTGKSCIAYRVVGGVMLASGDPLGDPEAWPGAMAPFMAEARLHAWIPAVAGCGEQAARVWRREAGLEAFEIGDEAVVEVEDFSLEGRTMRNVRQMVNRTARSGYLARCRRMRDVPPDELIDLAAKAEAWREGGGERGYSMALDRFGAPQDGDCLVVTAERDGVVAALLHLVPWGTDGLSLDLMRRDRDAEPGLNDFLIVSLLQQGHGLGITRVSLNFAVFRSALERGERIGASPLTRAWRWTLLFASRWAQIDSLYRFNAKFAPEWEPRFVLYPSSRDFARVLVAYLRAEGFLTAPWSRPDPRTGLGRTRVGDRDVPSVARPDSP